MIYNGEFKDIIGKAYTIRITTKTGGSTQEMTLGGSPFITQMDNGGDTIYKPVKYQSATVGIITPDYNFDIYNAKAQDTKVELMDNNGLVWTGYVTPNLYDMGFVQEREEVQIECIDALSTLQYIKYESPDKGMITFLDLVRKILQRCNAYIFFYVSCNTNLVRNSTASLLDKLYISENNFFDKKEDKETDEDVAWTMKDVLEEICKYLGLTAIADGDSVYLLDYDAIKQGRNIYHRYNVDGEDTGTLVTVSYQKVVTASDYSASGATLSLDNVYNKVSVTDDLYTFDSLIPDVFANKINITDTFDQAMVDNNAFSNNEGNVALGRYPVFINNTASADIRGDANTIGFVVQPNFNDGKNKITDVVFARYFDSADYKFFKYTRKNQNELEETTLDRINYTTLQNMIGATAAQYFVKKVNGNFRGSGRREIFNNLMTDNYVDDVRYTNYIALVLQDNNCYAPLNYKTSYPFFQTRSNDNSVVFGGKNAYILISGSLRSCHIRKNCYPCTLHKQIEYNSAIVADNPDALYLTAKLEWNGLYWNGTNWTDQDSSFQITFIKGNQSNEERALEKFLFTDVEFLDTKPWYAGVDGKGYLIPMPEDQVIGGQPIFTMYCQSLIKLASGKFGSGNLPANTLIRQDCMLLKDFSIKAIIGDLSSDQANDSDTVYTNIIDGGFVTELKAIKFKICTWDNKKPNYSSVAYKVGGNYKYLDKMFNAACYEGEQEWTGSDGDATDGLRQEEHLIYRLVNQYSTPSVILKLSLRNNNKIYGLYRDTSMGDKEFVVDSVDVDYKNNKQDIRLIEKK